MPVLILKCIYTNWGDYIAYFILENIYFRFNAHTDIHIYDEIRKIYVWVHCKQLNTSIFKISLIIFYYKQSIAIIRKWN